MSETPKFCKDCRYIRDAQRETFEKCAHPSSMSWNLTSGEQTMKYTSSARTAGDICGPSAKLFEARETEKAA